MTFQLVNYGDLKRSIHESIKQLIQHHYPAMSAMSDTSELKGRVALLEPERRTQAEVLLAVIEMCDSMREEELSKKQLILNAAAFDIYSQIKKSYEKGLIAYLTTAENSTFFQSLETSLALTKTNTPNIKEQLDLFKALEEFFKVHVYVDGNPENGCRTPDTSLFWLINNGNESFKPIEHVKRLGRRVYKLENKLHDEADKLHEKAARPPASNSSLFSWFSRPVKTSEPAAAMTSTVLSARALSEGLGASTETAATPMTAIINNSKAAPEETETAVKAVI